MRREATCVALEPTWCLRMTCSDVREVILGSANAPLPFLKKSGSASPKKSSSASPVAATPSPIGFGASKSQGKGASALRAMMASVIPTASRDASSSFKRGILAGLPIGPPKWSGLRDVYEIYKAKLLARCRWFDMLVCSKLREVRG